MKRIALSFITLLILLLCITGCGSSVNRSYSVGMFTSYSENTAVAKFRILDGFKELRLKIHDGQTARIQYYGKLESGSLVVYCESGDEITELFTLQGGEETELISGESFDGTVRIYISTNEKCKKGAFGFGLVYD